MIGSCLALMRRSKGPPTIPAEMTSAGYRWERRLSFRPLP